MVPWSSLLLLAPVQQTSWWTTMLKELFCIFFTLIWSIRSWVSSFELARISFVVSCIGLSRIFVSTSLSLITATRSLIWWFSAGFAPAGTQQISFQGSNLGGKFFHLISSHFSPLSFLIPSLILMSCITDVGHGFCSTGGPVFIVGMFFCPHYQGAQGQAESGVFKGMFIHWIGQLTDFATRFSGHFMMIHWLSSLSCHGCVFSTAGSHTAWHFSDTFHNVSSCHIWSFFSSDLFLSLSWISYCHEGTSMICQQVCHAGPASLCCHSAMCLRLNLHGVCW